MFLSILRNNTIYISFLGSLYYNFLFIYFLLFIHINPMEHSQHYIDLKTIDEVQLSKLFTLSARLDTQILSQDKGAWNYQHCLYLKEMNRIWLHSNEANNLRTNENIVLERSKVITCPVIAYFMGTPRDSWCVPLCIFIMFNRAFFILMTTQHNWRVCYKILSKNKILSP